MSEVSVMVLKLLGSSGGDAVHFCNIAMEGCSNMH